MSTQKSYNITIKKELLVEVFNSLDDLPEEYIENLRKIEEAFLNYNYLAAIERTQKRMGFRYCFISKMGKYEGFAYFQLLKVELSGFLENRCFNPLKIPVIKNVANKLLTLKMLSGGNAFSTGQHFIYGFNAQESISIGQELAAEMLIKEGSNANSYLIKDFYQAQYTSQAYLGQTQPNMVLKLQDNWMHIDDYLNDLTSKYRTKYRGALKKSSQASVRLLSIDDLQLLKPQLQQLYNMVLQNAGYKLAEFEVDGFKAMAELFGDKFIAYGWFFEGELKGFLTAIVNGKCLECHMVGFDYELNRECAIYPCILNKYIEIGLQQRVEAINFGRTASEIKSTFGALPQDVYYYFKHNNSILNSLISTKLSEVTHPEWKQHQVFKQVSDAAEQIKLTAKV